MAGWHHGAEVLKETPCHCESVGWLVSRDKQQVRLALSYNTETGNLGDFLVIPARCVIKVTILDAKEG